MNRRLLVRRRVGGAVSRSLGQAMTEFRKGVAYSALLVGMLLATGSSSATRDEHSTVRTPAEPCAPDNGGITLPDGFCATVFADKNRARTAPRGVARRGRLRQHLERQVLRERQAAGGRLPRRVARHDRRRSGRPSRPVRQHRGEGRDRRHRDRPPRWGALRRGPRPDRALSAVGGFPRADGRRRDDRAEPTAHG